MRNVLLDTGALVALLDRSEKKHINCVDFFRDFKGRFILTEPVLTEALYLLNDSVKAQQACISFFIKRGADLIPQSSGSLSRAAVLMQKYSDIPMDFADATLVTLAEDSDINEIFTLDIRGFRAYRINGKKSFSIFPE